MKTITVPRELFDRMASDLDEATELNMRMADQNHWLRVACRVWAKAWSDDTGQDMPDETEIFRPT